MTTMTTLTDFIATHALEMTYKRIAAPAHIEDTDWGKTAFHWEVTIVSKKLMGTFTTTYSKGSANVEWDKDALRKNRYNRDGGFTDEELLRLSPVKGARGPGGYPESIALANCRHALTRPIPPALPEVLDAIAADARCVDTATFKDFCGEFGYNTDSIKALAIYNACIDIRTRLYRFFGPIAYHTHLYETEVL